MTIHWLGVGLSALPGLKRLIGAGYPVWVWNRTVSKVASLLGDDVGKIEVIAFDLEELARRVQAADIVVSMLPGTLHVGVAEICLEVGANFVSSSYISPQMQALDDRARTNGSVLLNEVGLDPGMDHMLAHDLVRRYRSFRDKEQHADQHRLRFRSYCGGLGAVPNDFRYQFSWSPLGVLKALLSPSKSLRAGRERVVEYPWTAIESYSVAFESRAEIFEVYPNRDSLPFIAEYHFGHSWHIEEFVRGTLRYQGWGQAWEEIFAFLRDLPHQANPDQALENLSAELRQKYPLEAGENDRVVLCVELSASIERESIWQQSYVLEAYGSDETTAIAHLTSTPVAMMAEAVMRGKFAPGVQAAPHDPQLYQPLLDEIALFCRIFERREIV